MDPSTRAAEGTPLERYTGSVAGQTIMLALAALGYSAEDLDAAGYVGFRKSGQPIHRIAGGDDAGLAARIDSLTTEIRNLAQVRQESAPTGNKADGARYAAALDGSRDVAAELAELDKLRGEAAATKAKAELDAAVKAQVQEYLKSVRSPSMAGAIGDGNPTQQRSLAARAAAKASPLMMGIFGEDYEAGSLVQGIAGFKGQLSDGIDIDVINASKAKLQELGVVFMGPADKAGGVVFTGSDGKATLGITGATGGYVLPNNLVDAVVKPKTQAAVYRNFVRVINGVAVRGVDQPYRLTAPSRMTAQDWGATKENLDESYGSYTATLVTFARIYDVAKQYLRFSAGSAETDIMDELTRAADLTENYEIIAAAGGGSQGVGDLNVGVYTSLNATPSFLGYKTAFSGASNSTVAGSLAAAIAQMMGSLAARNRTPNMVVTDATTYFTALAQGSDTAGFWISPDGGPTGFTKTESGGIAFWGVPIFYDTNLGTNATTKIAIAAEWDAFKLYRGMEFRIDSSDVAGTRWDKNLVGFRGEMELGFNAETGVHVGAAQLLTAVIP